MQAPKEDTRQLNATIKASIKKAISIEAAKQERSISSIVEQALEEWLEKHQEEKP